MQVNIGKQSAKMHRRIHFNDLGADGKSVATGFTTEESGVRSAELELIIDVEKLVRFCGASAILSRGRKKTIQCGAIILRVKRGTETETTIPHVHNGRCYKDGKIVCDMKTE